MKIKSTEAIYHVVEEALSQSEHPQSCAALMDRPEVRAAAVAKFGADVQIATNKLSDILSFMWRKGVLDRFPAPPSTSMARYAYALRNQILDSKAISKHALQIVEREGEVVLDFKQFTIVIKPK